MAAHLLFDKEKGLGLSGWNVIGVKHGQKTVNSHQHPSLKLQVIDPMIFDDILVNQKKAIQLRENSANFP
jgi:hypothetical protein